ncbi:MAG TPA: hypothetical protein DEQ43_21025 [Nocardioides bacterium]|uniref:universal stress protein n=1 Tax=uncultured Nocardioides sp. TaxID=198441 RepID=UPI000EEA5880|nr:universal stress protein [uncultured Nocardioides sp.]HCB06691.1 hypothetical protein [Nocardioides sp.]HRD63772.1 universal stress protein [Nocardioides sp.]HRK48245.1 universal stress protein [Nocardioides sp.]
MTGHPIPRGSIVVGVDGSEHADRAVDWAAEQAALEHRTLALVHGADQLVLRDTAWLDVQGIDHRELAKALRQAADAVVASARGRALSVAAELDVVTDVVDADPRVALSDLSSRAHLVVLGSRGRGPVASAVLGSVSASVTRHAQCPVVVCRPPRERSAAPDRVVVGADGTTASRPVLEFAFQQASLRAAPLTVMHCFYDVAVATDGVRVIPAGSAEAVEELPDLRLLLAESVAGLAEKYPDVEVTQQLARGLVDQCLSDHAPDAALVVVGRTDAHGWSRFLHASCALAVLERAHTTVAVVPEGT